MLLDKQQGALHVQFAQVHGGAYIRGEKMVGRFNVLVLPCMYMKLYTYMSEDGKLILHISILYIFIYTHTYVCVYKYIYTFDCVKVSTYIYSIRRQKVNTNKLFWKYPWTNRNQSNQQDEILTLRRQFCTVSAAGTFTAAALQLWNALPENLRIDWGLSETVWLLWSGQHINVKTLFTSCIFYYYLKSMFHLFGLYNIITYFRNVWCMFVHHF